MPKPLRIGTRGSALALVQARQTMAALAAVHPQMALDTGFELVTITTTGDAVTDRPLYDIGGKGLFTKEIERALVDGQIDVAVHSLKDVPAAQTPALAFPAMLPREDPRDAFCSHRYQRLDEMPAGAKVGTSAPRRRAQILARYPHLTVVPLRGNVDTRLDKVARGAVDAAVLAMAGLRRLDRADAATQVLETQEMLPAATQGIVALQCRARDRRVRDLLAPLNNPDAATAAAAERAMVARLEGSCRSPIACLARPGDDGRLVVEGLVADMAGTRVYRDTVTGPVDQAAELGFALADKLLAAAGPDLF